VTHVQQHGRRGFRRDPARHRADILDLANVSNYWIEAIDGAVILFALFLARIAGGESTAEER